MPTVGISWVQSQLSRPIQQWSCGSDAKLQECKQQWLQREYDSVGFIAIFSVVSEYEDTNAFTMYLAVNANMLNAICCITCSSDWFERLAHSNLATP